MRIRKFNEVNDDSNRIADDTLQTILDKLTKITGELDTHKKDVESIKNTLSNFRSKSKSSNTQIDDSYVNLETIESKISDSLNLLDTVVNNLKDYNESGEKELY